MSLETVRRLLDEHKWELCAALAEEVFLHGKLTSQEKAFVCYARCRSLSYMEKYSSALEPGQIAVVLAEEVRDYDLLGRSLVELGYAQGHVLGQELCALETLRKCIGYKDHYEGELKEKTGLLYHNLAVTERAALLHEQALEHFRLAWEAYERAGEQTFRERVRRNYCWQALVVGDLALASRLIALGESQLKFHPQDSEKRMHLLVDQAQFALLNEDYPLAVSLAMEAIALADKVDDRGVLASSLNIWSQSCERLGNLHDALMIGIWALREAQRAARPEFIALTRRNLRGIRMDDRQAVDVVMSALLRTEGGVLT